MINMQRLISSIIKEGKILIRDKEALMILFIMPVIFVVIMSLAMRDTFKSEEGALLGIALYNQDQGEVGKKIVEAISALKIVQVYSLSNEKSVDEEAVKRDFAEGKYKFAFIIPPDVTGSAEDKVAEKFEGSKEGGAEKIRVRLLADPTLRSDHVNLVSSALNRILQSVESAILMKRLKVVFAEIGLETALSSGEGTNDDRIFSEVTLSSDGSGSGESMPSSVQQSVPAYSLFAMFFLVIPLSGTFIKERMEGSLLRLKSMPVPSWIPIVGKIVPYFIVNQIQIFIIFMVGIFIMPLIGGDRLDIGNSPLGIVLVTFASSIAAIGYGLMVAVFCRTSEQATTFGGVSVIILAAIGGIMVPKFIMPPLMQSMAELSPLSWGLEGFLDIFVRNGNVTDIIPELSMLLTFGLICLSIAIIRFRFILR
ncbi:MAG: ABC transporter permease [bacterium]|nr:ABC transporter permease [bacterium]